MMKKRICSSLVLLACAVIALAQGVVRGKVMDKQTTEVLQFVNIRVNNAATGKMVKGTVTDADGKFHLSGLPIGQYQLSVSYVGYKTLNRKFAITKEKNNVHFTQLFIAEDHHALQEVTVTGQRSQMKLEVDRKTFSVDQVLAAAGGTASDLLENIPSVEVSTDGEISLRGNSSVEVWINGKASGLTSDNRGEILQQIPAESIERVEIIDNPGAKFSPEGSAGIINIILKRDRKAGYYGSVRTGVNTKGGWNAGGNINYSSGVIDAFANVGFRKRKNNGGAMSEQIDFTNNSYQNYETENSMGGHNLFSRAGLTWHATEKDDISLSGMAMLGKRSNESIVPYHYGTVGQAGDTRMMYRQTESESQMRMYNVELGYTHKFAEGHQIELNLSHHRWKSDEDNFYRDSTLYLRPQAPTRYVYQYRPMFINNRSWEAKVDYENKISDNLKLEAGYNLRLSHENTPQESWADNNSWWGTQAVEDQLYFNRFIYDMDVHALYTSLNFKLGKLGVTAGLRGEYWKVKTESYTYEQEHDASLREKPFEKDYFQLFPSLFLNYPLSETSQIQLNYTRRLRRPWGGELNSFKNTRDASMISFGNPELTPEYTNSFGLNFLKTWNNHTLSLGSYYRPTTDVIQRVAWNENGVMYSTNENVAKSQSAGVELILKDKLWRVLDLTTTVNGYYYKLDGFNYVINNQVVSGQSDENFSWDARVLAALILPFDISVQATGNYRSRRVITQGYRKSNMGLDLGIRKSFFNKTITLAFNWRDVFNSHKHESYTGNDTFWRHQKNWRDPRVNFVVSWNFGNMNQKKKNRQEDNQQIEESESFGGYE